MVPVPEELAPKVLSYVSWKGHPGPVGASGAQADEAPSGVEGSGGEGGEPVARAFARLDDVSRAMVTAVAAAALEDELLSIPEAARRAGITTREAIGVLFEVNTVLAAEGVPAMGFNDLGASTADESMWDSRIIVMTEALTRPLTDLARLGPQDEPSRPCD
jgi:hypothetical protein